MSFCVSGLDIAPAFCAYLFPFLAREMLMRRHQGGMKANEVESRYCCTAASGGVGVTLREIWQQHPQKRALSVDLVTAAPTVGPAGAALVKVPAVRFKDLSTAMPKSNEQFCIYIDRIAP